MSWRRAWEPTSVFLPGKSHEQRSLAGHSPWGLKELDTTEAAEHAHTFIVSDVSVFHSQIDCYFLLFMVHILKYQ